jgi:phosphoglycerol transferase MdoB-like AlkP superfamily enzyme
MRESSDNDMAYVLPKFFATEDVKSYAYHNNSLSYYDRYLSHPNLGYDFKCSLLGNLPAEEWETQVFPMENPKAWPASDLEMMQGTMPEYLQQERFHVYYLTVSGHMNYNFSGNAMSSKNREAVAELNMSETARAYLACNIELDKALEYMLAELEAAGQLERTVICLSADHYPYAMPTENYEELAGKSLSEGMDMYRNSLILWNVGMEEDPVYVEKVCGSMDLLPTLLNMFGFEYDSRMYAGRDIFSEGEGLVIFKDRSFVTDSLTYVKKGKSTVWTRDEDGNDFIPDEEKEAYLDRLQQEVKERYQFSAYILQEDYYTDVEQALMAVP